MANNIKESQTCVLKNPNLGNWKAGNKEYYCNKTSKRKGFMQANKRLSSAGGGIRIAVGSS